MRASRGSNDAALLLLAALLLAAAVRSSASSSSSSSSASKSSQQLHLLAHDPPHHSARNATNASSADAPQQPLDQGGSTPLLLSPPRRKGPAAPGQPPASATALSFSQLQQLTSELRELMQLHQERQQGSNTSAPCPAAAQLHQLLDAWDADAGFPSCSSLAPQQLRQRLAALEAAVARLGSCSTMASLAPTRRYCVAMMWKLHAAGAGCGQAAELQRQLRPAYARVLLMLQLQHQETLAARRLSEFSHISKSGGTTLCSIAQTAGCSSESFSSERNCMIRALQDEPARALFHKLRLRDASLEMAPFCAYRCPGFIQEPKASCAERRALLEAAGYNFYASEQPLRYYADTAAAGGQQAAHPHAPDAPAGVCRDFVNIITLRDPLAHVLSHIHELLLAFVSHIEHKGMGPLARHVYAQPSGLAFVQSIAPAVLDNLYVRTLMGRGYMCRLVGTLGRRDAQLAMAQLLQFDSVLVLELAVASDASIRHGLGWQRGVLSRLQLRQRQPSSWMLKLDTPDNRQRLESMQQLDRQVHAFGAQLALLDGAFFATAAELMQGEPVLLAEAAAALLGAAVAADPHSTRRPGSFRRYQPAELRSCGFVAAGHG